MKINFENIEKWKEGDASVIKIWRQQLETKYRTETKLDILSYLIEYKSSFTFLDLFWNLCKI